MHNTDAEQSRNTRIETPGEEIAGIVQPRRIGNTRLFPGWGPKLFAIAFAITSVYHLNQASSASAETLAALSCSADRAAQILSNSTPMLPNIAREQGVEGNVVLRISLSAAGRLESAAVARSSGNPLLDEEALRVARQSRYAPEIHACQHVAGAYFYEVGFDTSG
jgi:TonB family protein